MTLVQSVPKSSSHAPKREENERKQNEDNQNYRNKSFLLSLKNQEITVIMIIKQYNIVFVQENLCLCLNVQSKRKRVPLLKEYNTCNVLK